MGVVIYIYICCSPKKSKNCIKNRPSIF